MLSIICYVQELRLKVEHLQRMNRNLKQKSSELEKARLPASPNPSNASLNLSQSDLATVDEESQCSVLQDELEQVCILILTPQHAVLSERVLKLRIH